MVVKRILFAFLLFTGVLLSTGSAPAQKEVKNPLIKMGETLTYEGKFSKLILRGIDVAELTVTVQPAPEGNDYLVRAEAKSKGGILKLFGFTFYQRIETLLDGSSLRVVRTVKRDEQGDRVRDSRAEFDFEEDKVSYIETDPNDLTRPPRVIASPIEAETHDILSAIYMLRRLPLEVGKEFELSVSDSGLVYKVPIRVTGREKIKSSIGKKWCFRLEPEVFGEGRLIEREGKMIIWITDDERRLPVRSQINTSLGKVVLKLEKISNLVEKPTASKTTPRA